MESLERKRFSIENSLKILQDKLKICQTNPMLSEEEFVEFQSQFAITELYIS